MKFSVSLSEFQKVLQNTMPAIPRKSTLPVLEHLHFSLKEGKLKLIATDQDITIMSVLDVNSTEEGSILVPARKMSDITKALGSTGEFEFITNDENYEISIKTKNGKYAVKGLNPNEYLDLPELFKSEKPDLTMPSSGEQPLTVMFKKEDIINIAEKTVFAVSTDEFRPAMTGVLFEFKGIYINAVATDSFRLVRIKVRPDEGEEFPDELNLIVPARAVELLKKVDQDVLMSVVETNSKITHTRFDIGSTVFITKIIDEKFPPYDSVIPNDNSLNASVGLKDVSSAIKRVSIVTSKISNQIKIKFAENLISIMGEDEESGDYGNEEVSCEYSGEELTIGFNFKFLDDALSHLDSDEPDKKVAFSFSEANRPILIKTDLESDDLLMLIMPVRIS